MQVDLPANQLFAPLRGANARVDYVERLARVATRREPACQLAH
jgi:hypothetical protein